MADYITQTDIERYCGGSDVVIQLTDDAGTGSVVTAVLDECIADAEADVNARLNKGYTLPITVVDHGQMAFDTVKQLCLRTVRYHLMMRRPETVTEVMANDYHEALKTAEAMAKGGHALPGDPPVQRSSPESSSGQNRIMADRSTKPTNRNWDRDTTGNM